MTDIENKSYQPDFSKISAFVNNSLFDELYGYMQSEYKPVCSIEYSGDKALLGWNVKYKKAGKTLCTVYPRESFFYMLLIVGRKEKERVEEMLPSMSPEFRAVYGATQEGMGQRWILMEFKEHNALYDDVLKVIRIRRESK